MLDRLENDNVDYFVDNLIDFTECGENPDICLDSRENADKVKDIIRDIKNEQTKTYKNTNKKK